METRLDQKDYSYVEATSQTIRTIEEDMHRHGIDFPNYDIATVKASLRLDDSTPIRQIGNDDGKSAVFQEMLFTEAAIRVFRRNRKLFEELAKY